MKRATVEFCSALCWLANFGMCFYIKSMYLKNSKNYMFLTSDDFVRSNEIVRTKWLIY